METYKKDYGVYDQDELSVLYRKYQYLNDLTIDGVVFPRVVGRDDTALFFEKIDMSKWTMLPLVITELNNVSRRRLYRRIGQVLGLLHLGLQPRSYIHGDFFPRNIYISNRDDAEILILDFDPPHNVENKRAHIVNQKEKDVACFLVRAPLVLPPTGKVRFLIESRSLLKEFLNGYQSKQPDLKVELLNQHAVAEVSEYRRYLSSISWYKRLFWLFLMSLTSISLKK